MKPLRSEMVELAVLGPDEATEIFLIDPKLKRIGSAVGTLTAKIAPGIYKIRCRSGTTQSDRLIQVPEGQTTHTVSVPPVQFRATTPIADTKTTHESQSTPAAKESRKTHLSIGQHSQIFLFAREMSAEQPWAVCDIALHDLQGTRLAGIEEGFSNPEAQIAGINIELNPGTYAVRIGNAAIGSYEMYVTASPGWQTQLFFSFEDFWSQGTPVRAPSIRQASLLMARPGDGFDPHNESSRTSELARQALAQGRDVLSRTLMDRLLSGKYEDPVLGLIAAHLLLRRRPRNLALLETVCGNLRSMLGEHPDVQALELAVDTP